MKNRKRLLYIHQYFKKPTESGGVRSYHVAKGFIDKGYQVVMLTTSADQEVTVQNVEGIEVHYLPVSYDQSMGFIRRILSFLQFFFFSLKYIKKLGDFYFVFATSTPVTVGFIALLLKKRYGWPYVFEVRDLWPEVPEKLGLTPFWWPSKMIHFMVNKVYASARLVIVLSEVNINAISRLIALDKIISIPNFSDCELVPASSLKRNENKIRLIYAGSLGFANYPQGLVELAKTMDTDFHGQFELVVAGTGSEEDVLKRYSVLSSSLTFKGSLSKDDVRQEVECSDLVLVHFRMHPALEQNSPNKLYDALGQGRPCAITMKEGLLQLLEENNCGFHYDYTQPKLFLETVLELHQSGKLLAMRENAKKLAQSHFDRSQLVPELCGQVIKAINDV